jgi:hypothetical protein
MKLSPPKKQQIQNLCPKNISENNQKLTNAQDIKMDIELNDLNQLNGSVSTQSSNNIKSPLESKDLDICNTNTIFFPQNKIQIENQKQIIIPKQTIIQNQIQTQVSIPLKKIKE